MSFGLRHFFFFVVFAAVFLLSLSLLLLPVALELVDFEVDLSSLRELDEEDGREGDDVIVLLPSLVVLRSSLASPKASFRALFNDFSSDLHSMMNDEGDAG